MPIATVLSGANRHDSKMVKALMSCPVVPRPKPTTRRKQHLAADKAYDSQGVRRAAQNEGYVVHIPKRGHSPKTCPVIRHPARRWVVERTAQWQNLFRRLKTRYEVYSRNYLGFVEFANAIICFRSSRR